MGLFKRATKKLAQRTAQTVWMNSTIRSMEKLRRNARPRDIAAQEAIAHAIGEVHNCASKNADTCAEQTIRLMRRVPAGETARKSASVRKTVAYMKSGKAGTKATAFAEGGTEIEEVTDHPILDLLNNPNPDYPGTQLAWMRFYMREITGKAYELIGYGSDGYPSALYPMPSQYVEPIFGDDGIEGFRYARSETSVADIEKDDVIFYRHRVSRFNPLDGEGPMVGVLAEADLLLSNLVYDLASVQNGNRIDSVWSVDDIMATPEQLEELEQRINSKYGGPGNAGKTYVTSGKVSVTPIVWPEKELQSLAKTELYAKNIRKAFGHTESMNDSNVSTYAAALVGKNQYAEQTIRPRLNQDAAHLNKNLLWRFGLDETDYCLIYDDPVVEDVEALNLRVNADIAAGKITVNEGRAEQGLDPSDDPAADELRVNGVSYKTLDAAPAQETGGGLDIPAIFRGAGKGSSVKSLKQAAAAYLFKGMIDDELPEWRVCGCVTKDDDDIANEPLIEQVYRDYLRKVETEMEGIVREAQDEVIDAVRAGRPSELDPIKERAATVLAGEMRSIIDDGVRFTLQAAGQDIDAMFDVAQTSALEFLDRHVITVADDIASTTDSMIRPAIERGIEQGLSIDQIATEMDGLPKWRAERIARTEVQNAAQGARYETFKEIGVELVQWVTAPGASKAHTEIATRVYYEGGKPGVQKMGEPFVKAGEVLHGEKFTRSVYAPPARPNCRCSIRAIHDTSGGDE